MNRNKKAIIVGVSFIVMILLLKRLGVGSYFSIKNLQHHSSTLRTYVEHDYLTAAIVYVLIYALLIACALPVTGPLSILGGYLFHIIPGTAFGVLGATVGSTISFLFIRYVISNAVREKYKDQLDRFNEKITQYGYGYLLTLQLLTVIPFFVINTLAALTNVPLHTFVWTTAVGALPILFVYTLAGRELATLTQLSDILKPHVILILLLLAGVALLPMIIKRLDRFKD